MSDHVAEQNVPISQAEFARLAGYARSYVTALKQAGRLVMTADGRVDPEASFKRIEETRDPNREDVSVRHARARGSLQHAGLLVQSSPEKVGIADHPTPSEIPARVSGRSATDVAEVGQSYQAARAMKERYAALSARLEYERAAGLSIDREAVAQAISDVVLTLGQALDQLPHRVSPDLVGCDIDTIRVRLKREIYAARQALAKQLEERLQQIAGQQDMAA